jgi:ubiquinone/menaquinone biosynthesis C-methylase UbiE
MKNIIKKIKLKLLFKKNFLKFKKLSKKDGRFDINWENKYPCLYDNTEKTKFDAHYIYHPAWASRILTKTKPEKHIDISSTLHFCSIVSAFIPVEFYDLRPAKLNLNNLISKEENIINLHFKDNSIKSLSCMHTIEHIGLGRYGDELDPNGDLKAINELKRVLAKEGDLLFVVPIGKPKLMFNAHRIYSYDQILEYFKDLKLQDFSLITDKGEFINNSNKTTADNQNYGCGCFWFKK